VKSIRLLLKYRRDQIKFAVDSLELLLQIQSVVGVWCITSDDGDDEYDGDDPVIVTASADHHVDAFGDVDDDGFTDELPHVGVVHGNGDGLCFNNMLTDQISGNSIFSELCKVC